MIAKNTKPHIFNHRLGQIVLFPAVRPESGLRIRKLADGSLERFGRAPDGRWVKDLVEINERFQQTLMQYLTMSSLTGYFYLDTGNVQVTNRRFSKLKASLQK